MPRRRRTGEDLQAQFVMFLRSKQTVGLRTSSSTIPTRTSLPSPASAGSAFPSCPLNLCPSFCSSQVSREGELSEV